MSFIVKATRAIHRAAVGLHLAGLRTTVSTAYRRTAAAQAEAKRADAVVNQAIEARRAANFTAGHRAAEQQAIEYAARQEAKNIGASL